MFTVTHSPTSIFFSNNNINNNMENIIERDTLVRRGLFPASDDEISEVATGIRLLAETEGGEVLCGTNEVRDVLLNMAKSATMVKAKIDILFAIAKIVEGSPSAQKVFSDGDVYDTLLTIGLSSVADTLDPNDSNELRSNVCGVIANLCDDNITGQRLFDTTNAVDMFSEMGLTASSDNARKWIANAIASIVENNPAVGQRYATGAIGKMLVAMGCAATSLAAITSIVRTIGILIQNDAKSASLFKALGVVDMLNSMWTTSSNLDGASAADSEGSNLDGGTAADSDIAKHNIASLRLSLNGRSGASQKPDIFSSSDF